MEASTSDILTGQWPMPPALYTSLDSVFHIDRVIHCNPMNVPLEAPIYHSAAPEDNAFSAEPLTNTSWQGMSLSLPLHHAAHLTTALEQAIYGAHTMRHKSRCSTLLLLPSWKHTPYLTRNLHNNGYVQKIATIPYAEPNLTHHKMPKYNLNLYLVANGKTLETINAVEAKKSLSTTLSRIYGVNIQVCISCNPPIVRTIESTTKYGPDRPHAMPLSPTLEVGEPDTPTGRDKAPLAIRDHAPMWDKRAFAYTDGSLIKGMPTLGAAVAFPGQDDEDDEVIRIKVVSQPERHTINRAELSAIAVAIRERLASPTLSILTDSAFSINTIRNHIADPASYTHHLHVDLLRLVDGMLRTRDANNFPTHIGKVKSHIDIHYNEVADEGAHSVAAGDAEPDIIFNEADPPIGGLRTWPVHRELKDDAPDVLTNFTNLKTDARAYAKRATVAQNQPTTLFGRLLRNAKTQGADYSIHAYSRSAYIDKRNSLEVAWGVHRYRLQPKFGKHQPLLCGKCQQKLTNTHILGGCYSTSRLRIARHHSTFKLLVERLKKSNGGRWPILSMDLGNGPVRDFDTQLKIEREHTFHQTHENHMGGTPSPTPPSTGEEGMQDYKSDVHYTTTVPDYLLPPEDRPQHCKPDIIRAVGYTLCPSSGMLIPDLTYKGRRVLQIIECKFSTDFNMHEVVDHIPGFYTPLKDKILQHGAWTSDIDIIPIVISRTGSFSKKTLAQLSQLISFKDKPPDELTYKELPRAAQDIAMQLHTHAQSWLTLMSRVSSQTLTPPPRTSTQSS